MDMIHILFIDSITEEFVAAFVIPITDTLWWLREYCLRWGVDAQIIKVEP